MDARLLHRLPDAGRHQLVRPRGARSGRPHSLGRHRNRDRLAILHRRRHPVRRASGGGDPESGLMPSRAAIRDEFVLGSCRTGCCWRHLSLTGRHDSRRASLRRHRGARRYRTAAAPGRRRLEGLGPAHRFAGSGDRAAIAGLVYDTLRRKASASSCDGRDDAARDGARHVAARAQARWGCDRAARRRRPLRAGSADRRRARAARRQRRSTARRPGSPATIPNGSMRHLPRCSAMSVSRKAPRCPHARRSICGSTHSRASARKPLQRWPTSRPWPTRWSPVGLRIVVRCRTPRVPPSTPSLPSSRGRRSAGRRLAACGADRRRKARRAGGRSVRRRRRQDAGARRHDGEPRADLSPPTPTSAGWRRSMQRLDRAGARNVQVRTPKSVGDARRRSRRTHGSRADRCAVYRHRRLAAQSGRQVAGAARARSSSGGRSRRRCSTARLPWSSPAAASPMSPARCSTEENGDQMRAFLARQSGLLRWCRPPSCRTHWASALSCSAARCSRRTEGLLMTPRRTDTDGFFVAMLRKSA